MSSSCPPGTTLTALVLRADLKYTLRMYVPGDRRGHRGVAAPRSWGDMARFVAVHYTVPVRTHVSERCCISESTTTIEHC